MAKLCRKCVDGDGLVETGIVGGLAKGSLHGTRRDRAIEDRGPGKSRSPSGCVRFQ